MLVDIWKQVLQSEHIGTQQHFFASGGDSLLAAQLANQLHQVFQCNVPLRFIFEAPTVQELATTLRAHEPTPGHVDTIARVIQRLKQMSVEEAAALLQTKQVGI